jgi:hypothetical protein
MGGFSFASVILSYFLISGGTFLTTLLAAKLGLHNEYLGYAIMAVGAFVGGFFAARASHGSTIVEPAIGAVVMVASIVGLGLAVSSSEARGAILLPANMKGIALTAAASAGGGIVGAFVSEKALGKATSSSAPWLLYVALAAFGAGVMGSIFGGVLGKGEGGPLIGMVALCSLLVGGAAGASARTRPLLASLFGGAIGVFAFFYLAVVIFTGLFAGARGSETPGIPGEVYGGLAIIAAGAGVVTLIGAAIGWAAVGKKNA